MVTSTAGKEKNASAGVCKSEAGVAHPTTTMAKAWRVADDDDYEAQASVVVSALVRGSLAVINHAFFHNTPIRTCC